MFGREVFRVEGAAGALCCIVLGGAQVSGGGRASVVFRSVCDDKKL